jgi:serine protease Do
VTGMLLFRISALCIVFSLIAAPCWAKMYKYKKDGVWHFTDTPPREMLEKSEVMAGSVSNAPAPSPGGTPLLTDFKALNPLEKAKAATVAVKGHLGSGSGFFVSTDGYILTNKHVIRTTKRQAADEKKFFEAVDGKIKAAEDDLADEKKRLDKIADKLKDLKRLADNETDSARKKSYEDEYAYRYKTYEDAKADHDRRRDQFESDKKKYLSQKSDYDYDKLVGNLSQGFEIVLADNTSLRARLVATSAGHDLALLKIDGYKTPCLKKQTTSQMMTGFPLYAVGNPATLRNSVTSGIFSGFENGFIKTNAQIYPGNSGGPLITALGDVVGVNTFKKLTHKFEGLGFAIPIGKAFDEFGKYLR